MIRTIGDRCVREVERRNGARQRLDQLAGAMRVELFDTEHIDRRQRFGDRAISQACTRNDYLIQSLWLGLAGGIGGVRRSEEHTSELQSLMRISSAVFCLKKKNKNILLTYMCTIPN